MVHKTGNSYINKEIGDNLEDWKSFEVGEVISFSGGSQPPLFTFSKVRKPGYVRLIQIRDYKSDKFEVFIPENLGRKFCDKEDIMIGRYGPPIFQILRGLNGAYNVALIKATPNIKHIDKDFAWHFLRNKTLFNFVEKLSQRSSGQTGVDLIALKSYPIQLPGLPEQHAIAQVLTDTDQLLQNLKKLIAKKKAIKQGSMQELLTGKKRLPGFEGEWEVKRLGEVGTIITGSTPSTTIKKYWNGHIPWITPTDINKNKSIYQSGRSLTLSGLECTRELPSGTLLVTCIASIGKNAILRQRGSCNQQINAIIPNNMNNVDYLYYLMELYSNYIESKAGITATKMVSKSVFSQIEFNLPKIEEQKAIAQILSDMDLEIEALEKQLHKTEQLKQGLMQELLTGKTRLVGMASTATV